jgi:DNA adenine methylase
MQSKSVYKNKLVRPFVKWAGGKRQILPEILQSIPHKFNKYFEPFVGGGALFFELQPKEAVINDLNSELINLYKVIKNNPKELIDELKLYQNTSDYFYKIRELDRNPNFDKLSEIKKASRILYLNKTCYNGLFRVNSQGQFNVPFGNYKQPNIINDIVIMAVSNYLNSANLLMLSGDFEESLKKAKKNDFVYLDPPYDPVSEISSFTGYTLNGFGKDEQKRLKNVCDRLNEKGVKFLLSNSYTDFINELYKKEYNINIISASRSINSIGDKRGKISEVLIRNY